MSIELEHLTIEDLEREIVKRNDAAKAELRKQLEEARKRVRELEAQLGDAKPVIVSTRRKPLPASERRERILAALSADRGISSGVLSAAVGAPLGSLRETLDELRGEGLVIRQGNKRSTLYRLAA